MNDNGNIEGPRHAEAVRLLSQLSLLFNTADGLVRQGEHFRAAEDFDFAYWADECKKVVSIP